VGPLNGGEIQVHWELGNGTEIIFTIPAVIAALKNVTKLRTKTY